MREKLKESMEQLGIGKETGLEKGGFWTPDQLYEAFEYFNLGILGETYTLGDELASLFGRIADHVDSTRAHELLHCATIALDSAELVRHIASDEKALDKIGVPRDTVARRDMLVTPQHANASAVAGIFHDLALSLRQDALERTTNSSLFGTYSPQGFAGPQFAKDQVGDDFRGAVLLDRYHEGVFGITMELARGALLSESDVPAHEGLARKQLGNYNPYKVQDAVAYHDGNYPVRGCAEVDMLVGDRVKLYLAGQIDEATVGKGIKKAMTYTEEDPAWEERGRKTDVDYLVKMVNKKAPGFIDAIRGTQTFDFLVAQAARQRGMQTVNSPAYWAGVAEMRPALKALEGVTELAGKYGREVETLYKRLERLEQLKPAELR
ncbi:hypothetical protein HY497_00230 [Candidatus Woesearchaeota archaeon]|nr:hypothetical protein [Candidatus Woesearchaeota archaeon]